MIIVSNLNLYSFLAQSAGAAEYTDLSLNKCPDYDTKQSDSATPVMLEL